MNDRNKIVVIAVVIFLIIAGFVGFKLFGGGSDTSGVEEEFVAPDDDPIDVTMEFYTPWFEARESTTTDPYQLDLLSSPLLSPELSEKLKSAVADGVPELDPVICQLQLPERIGAKIVYQTERESQVMVVPRGVKVPQSALVTLVVKDGEWLINDINCSNGDVPPEREYTFENEGNLLKDSLPAPLDNQYWHLVFAQDGKSGYTAPLFFDENSKCIATDGTESVCNPDQFIEAMKVLVKGEMTESGVTMKILEILE